MLLGTGTRINILRGDGRVVLLRGDRRVLLLGELKEVEHVAHGRVDLGGEGGVGVHQAQAVVAKPAE
jgi:hypothetical protein